eukprot:CAMPEP_0167827650 /NCGR_PEP_ID=MMETSP0112_2-20121227/10823_1 /TAXON_ID=91324 /ORGANISM="Lotharella globosa, Strain CCCM811" /LENGTH=39 /DNA_ID= /DNA_START= /DNA_END= /DNA_ORIENTATION=
MSSADFARTIANDIALRTKPAISAPEKPSVLAAKSFVVR